MKIPLLNLEVGKIKQDETEAASYVYAAINEIMNTWQVSDDRVTIYRDIDRMCHDDEYASFALESIVKDVFKITNYYDAMITVEHEDEKLRALISDILQRGQLSDNGKMYVADLFKFNNSYAEFIINPKTKKFERAQRIPDAWSVYRNTDIHGTLKGGDPAAKKVNICAYDQRDDNGSFLTGFFPYQVIHFRGAPWDKDGYGEPGLRSARKNWLRLNYIEDAAAFARIVRAYLKMVHQVPVGKDANEKDIKKAIKRYKENLQSVQINAVTGAFLRKENSPLPYKVDTDFFMPKSEILQGDIKTLDPQNAQLQNMTDVEYSLNRFFARLGAPKARLANEQDVRAKATMTEINSVYGGVIIGYQIDYLVGIKKIVDLALFLEGIDQEKLKKPYILKLPSPFIKSEAERAEIEYKEAQTAEIYVRSGVISREYARRNQVGMSDDESAVEAERVKGEQEDFPSMSGMQAFVSSESVKTDDQILKELYQVRKNLEHIRHA